MRNLRTDSGWLNSANPDDLIFNPGRLTRKSVDRLFVDYASFSKDSFTRTSTLLQLSHCVSMAFHGIFTASDANVEVVYQSVLQTAET